MRGSSRSGVLRILRSARESCSRWRKRGSWFTTASSAPLLEKDLVYSYGLHSYGLCSYGLLEKDFVCGTRRSMPSCLSQPRMLLVFRLMSNDERLSSCQNDGRLYLGIADCMSIARV